jgi:hypothetical protein
MKTLPSLAKRCRSTKTKPKDWGFVLFIAKQKNEVTVLHEVPTGAACTKGSGNAMAGLISRLSLGAPP